MPLEEAKFHPDDQLTFVEDYLLVYNKLLGTVDVYAQTLPIQECTLYDDYLLTVKAQSVVYLTPPLRDSVREVLEKNQGTIKPPIKKPMLK